MTTPAEKELPCSPALSRPCRTQEQVAIARLRRALRRLERWSTPFIENTPISAETLWREFPTAIKDARTVLADTAHLDGGGQG